MNTGISILHHLVFSPDFWLPSTVVTHLKPPRYRSTTIFPPTSGSENSLWKNGHLGHLYHLSFKFCTKWGTDLLTNLEDFNVNRWHRFFSASEGWFSSCYRWRLDWFQKSTYWLVVEPPTHLKKICACQNGFIFPLNMDANIFVFFDITT